MQDALWKMSAAAQAEAVRCAHVSAVELVDSHLDRIAEVNPQVNAVTQLLAERAREAAAQTDRRRAAGEALGPLAGVPFTVKESTAIEGVPTTFGTERFRDLVAAADAPPVARLRAAGAIPIGHSNVPTLILAGMHTRSELFGDTVNPWDSSRTPGGSSGGDAVAVATGMAALGLGNDSGGSVRVPAQFCGVAGLKPSTGRFPADHRVLGPDDPGLASHWPGTWATYGWLTSCWPGPIRETHGPYRYPRTAKRSPGRSRSRSWRIPVGTASIPRFAGPSRRRPPRSATLDTTHGRYRTYRGWTRLSKRTAGSP
jgi:hypothetical protein